MVNQVVDNKRIYVAIDLKSFYASVECLERKLDPLKTNLVVSDASRTEKTICLAVTPPSLKKSLGFLDELDYSKWFRRLKKRIQKELGLHLVDN